MSTKTLIEEIANLKKEAREFIEPELNRMLLEEEIRDLKDDLKNCELKMRFSCKDDELIKFKERKDDLERRISILKSELEYAKEK